MFSSDNQVYINHVITIIKDFALRNRGYSYSEYDDDKLCIYDKSDVTRYISIKKMGAKEKVCVITLHDKNFTSEFSCPIETFKNIDAFLQEKNYCVDDAELRFKIMLDSFSEYI